MSNLKSDYQKIEKGLYYWPERPNRGKNNQFYQLVDALRAEVRERSLNENLNPSLYEERLSKLLDFVSDLRDVLNPNSVAAPDDQKKDEQRVWYHRADYKVSVFAKQDDDPKIDREWLLVTAAKYLANPWLQNDQIDWIFLDSLIFAEMSAYRESILTGRAFGKTNWAYIFSGGDIMKFHWYKIAGALVFIALRYILPLAIIFLLYYFQYKTAFLIAGGVYAIYLVLRIILWPLRYRKQKLEQKILQEHIERLQKIIDAYYYCRPPIISLTTLHSYLNKAVEGGAIFDGALFSFLKRIEATRGEAFMPFTKSV